MQQYFAYYSCLRSTPLYISTLPYTVFLYERNLATGMNRPPTVSELLRYGAASLLAFVVDTGLLFALTSGAHVPYLISAPIAFSAGIIITYTLSIQYVFVHRTFTHSKKKEFLFFVIIGIFGLLLNEYLLWVCTSIFGFYYLVSKFFSAFVVFAWNFLARKLLLF